MIYSLVVSMRIYMQNIVFIVPFVSQVFLNEQ